jgi:hypothetical protein
MAVLTDDRPGGSGATKIRRSAGNRTIRWCLSGALTGSAPAGSFSALVTREASKLVVAPTRPAPTDKR